MISCYIRKQTTLYDGCACSAGLTQGGDQAPHVCVAVCVSRGGGGG